MTATAADIPWDVLQWNLNNKTIGSLEYQRPQHCGIHKCRGLCAVLNQWTAEGFVSSPEDIVGSMLYLIPAGVI